MLCCRLAELLQTSRNTLRGQLATAAAELGKYKLAVDMARYVILVVLFLCREHESATQTRFLEYTVE